MPDVVGYQDYVLDAPRQAEMMARRNADDFEPGPLKSFPFPNPPKAPRTLSLAGLHETVFLRTAAGRIIRTTDPLLRSCVYSSRLDPAKAGAWGFGNPHAAHTAFRSDAVGYLRQSSSAMCRTDVAAYYPSINLGILASLLLRWRCDVAAVDPMLRVFGLWQRRGQLSGLPIGCEASAVLGNAMLVSVDDAIAKESRHARWMDDILVFAPTMKACHGVIEPLDVAISTLGLERSKPKTRILNNRDAVEDIENRLLASLGYQIRKPGGNERLRVSFDRIVMGQTVRDPHEFRWIVRALENKRDPYAAEALADNPDVMNTDPRASGSYLLAVGLGKKRVHESIMRKLQEEPRDEMDALDLHLLRAESASHAHGKPEGRIFLEIAHNQRRRTDVRAWAYKAYANTSAWNERHVAEAVEAEQDPELRRAFAVTMRGRCSRNGRAFLARIVQRFPELHSTRRWVEAA